MGASATLEGREIAVEPGTEASLRLRVQNTGQVVDQFTAEVLGDAAAWSVVEPPSVSLLPGKQETLTVRFRPPRLPTVRAGQLPFGVRVASREDPAGSAVEEGTLVVGSFRETGAELVPTTSRGRASATHELAVDNRGNVPVRAALAASDPENALRFSFQPPAVSAAPGKAAFARLRVRPGGRFLSGPPRSHPFQVQVQPDGERQIAIEASMVQAALFDAWMRRAALLALAGVVALALFWFLALRPAIQSTAREAVASPLASQSAQIAALQKQSGGGGGGGGGATAPTPAPGPGGGSGASSGASFARRLSSSSAQYKVPAGATLSVTDLVFQNPAGEHGTVALQRDGTSLLVENLDNFRDLDYHFVTPITANANQTVSLATQCPTGCGNVAVYLNGSQKT